MKSLSQVCLAFLLLCFSPLAFAQGGPPPHAGQGRHAKAADDLSSLEHFLSMSDAQLDQLQQAIARVKAMSPEERTALKEKLLAYRQLPESERQAVRAGTGWLNDQDRRDWPPMMRSLADTERQAIQTEIQALPLEQRALRKHALLEAWRQKK